MTKTLVQVQIVAGEHSLSGNDGTAQNVKIKSQGDRHQIYRLDEGTSSDITLARVDSPLQLNANVRGVKLPDPGFKASDGMLTVAGWGWTKDDRKNSDKLRKVQLPRVDHQKCRQWYQDPILPTPITVSDDDFCVGHEGRGTGLCFGDNGGGIYHVDSSDGTQRLMGIVKTFVGCSVPKRPVVCRDIFRLTKWLKEIAGEPAEK